MCLCLIYIYRRIKNILCSKIWLFGEIKQGRSRKKISKQDIRDLQFAWKAVSTKSGKNFDSLPIKLRRRNIRKEKKKKQGANFLKRGTIQMQMSQKLCRVIGFSGKVSLSVIPFPSSFVRCLLKSRMRITKGKTVPGCIAKTSGMKRETASRSVRGITNAWTRAKILHEVASSFSSSSSWGNPKKRHGDRPIDSSREIIRIWKPRLSKTRNAQKEHKSFPYLIRSFQHLSRSTTEFPKMINL